jgi:hypothetical protein
MTKLKDLHELMRPNFLWNRDGLKTMQVLEEYEGSKDVAREIMVGLAEIHGFESNNVQDYLEMSYDSHRHNIKEFRRKWQEAQKRVADKTIYLIDDPIKKFYLKTSLVMNAISKKYKNNPYLKIHNYINYE